MASFVMSGEAFRGLSLFETSCSVGFFKIGNLLISLRSLQVYEISLLSEGKNPRGRSDNGSIGSVRSTRNHEHQPRSARPHPFRKELLPLKTPAIVLAGLIASIPLSSFAGPTSAPSGSASAGVAAQTEVLVGAGTAVPVHVVGTVSSGSAKADETFQIQVNDDVSVNGMVVFRKGAGGQGHIAEVDSAGGNGHSGALSLVFDYVYSVDGGRVQLSSASQKQAEEDRKGASSTATIIGFATFGIGGLFGHNLAHGRQKTVDEKTVMTAFVSDNVHVQSNEHAVAVRYDK